MKSTHPNTTLAAPAQQGAYILPTVLIGIVAISFDEATRKASNYQEMMRKMRTVQSDAAQKVPGFLTTARLALLQELFREMDADDELALDLNEIIPFYRETFSILFDIHDLSNDQMEALFHVMDMDGDTELGFAEFVMFLCVVKQIHIMCADDPGFARRTFFPEASGLKEGEDKSQASVELGSKQKQQLNSTVVKVCGEIASTFMSQQTGEGGAALPAKESAFKEIQDLLADRLKCVIDRELSQASTALHISTPTLVQFLQQVPEKAQSPPEALHEPTPQPQHSDDPAHNPLRGNLGAAKPLGASLDEPILPSKPWLTVPMVEKEARTSTSTMDALAAQGLLGDEGFDVDDLFAKAAMDMKKEQSSLRDSRFSGENVVNAVLRGDPSPLGVEMIRDGGDETSTELDPSEIGESLRSHARFEPRSSASMQRDGSVLEGFQPRTLPDTPPRRRPPGTDGGTKKRTANDFNRFPLSIARREEQRASIGSGRKSGNASQRNLSYGQSMPRSGPFSNRPSTTSESNTNSRNVDIDERNKVANALAWRRVINLLHESENTADVIEVEFQKSKWCLDIDDCLQLLESLGLQLNRRQLKQLHQDLDLHGNDTITFDEFVQGVEEKSVKCCIYEETAWQQICHALGSDKAMGAVEKLFAEDRDQDGHIRIVQIEDALSEFGVRLTAPQSAIIHDAIDTNRNGLVSRETFFSAIDSHKQSP